MLYYHFYNQKEDDYVMIEADGFDHACHLLFGHDDDLEGEPLDYHDWELHEIEEP